MGNKIWSSVCNLQSWIESEMKINHTDYWLEISKPFANECLSIRKVTMRTLKLFKWTLQSNHNIVTSWWLFPPFIYSLCQPRVVIRGASVICTLALALFLALEVPTWREWYKIKYDGTLATQTIAVWQTTSTFLSSRIDFTHIYIHG